MGKIYVNEEILNKGITKEQLIDIATKDSKGEFQSLQHMFGYAGSFTTKINDLELKIGRVSNKNQKDVYIDMIDNKEDSKLVSIYEEPKEDTKNE